MKHIFIILTFISKTSFAQDDEVAVKQAVNKMFDGMKKSNTVLIRSAFSSGSVLQTIMKNKEGKCGLKANRLILF